MLGTEPEIVANYVETGQVKQVFWPVLNHGNPSVFSTLTADCAGEQDPNMFWEVHHTLFTNQGELWGADRDYYVQTAVAAGADQAAFEACYDSDEGLARVMALDEGRRARGVFSQPTFDINGQVLAGSQPFTFFSQAIEAALSQSN